MHRKKHGHKDIEKSAQIIRAFPIAVVASKNPKIKHLPMSLSFANISLSIRECEHYY